MCGIAGAIGHIDDEIRHAVAVLNTTQTHRGPDGEGSWTSINSGTGPGCILSHRRLAIIDLTESGAQPMRDEDTGNVISYNGEVYNYRELRHELASTGVLMTSESDTEVILKLLRRGSSAVSQLGGMFAFAFWDAKTKAVTLVRDRLGVKPLYYTEVVRGSHRTVLFASEVRALLATGLIDRKLNPHAVANYLWNGFVNGPDTIVSNIRLLPAGHTLTLHETPGETMKPEQYWQLPTGDRPSTVNDVEQALTDAVTSRLIADVPLGVFLSGGVDSSAVAAIAAHQAADVKTFNIGFPESTLDESGYAEQVARSLGTDHHKINLTQADFTRQLQPALDSLDQPTFDQINTYFVSKAVRDAGMTVALAGTGGDELFGGYSSFREVPKVARLARLMKPLPDALKHLVARTVSRVMYPSSRFPPQIRWGKLADIFDTRGDLLSNYQVSYSLFTREFLCELNSTFDPGCWGLAGAAKHHLDALSSSMGELHQISLYELHQFIGQRLLRDTDAGSMAVSLEARVPLLDYKLVEAVAGLNAEERFSPLGSKQLLRNLGLKSLDPGIFDRPKSGFVMPFEQWVKDSIKGKVEDTLKDDALCRRLGLNPRAIASLWDAYAAGAPGMYWSRPWSLFVLLDWCRSNDVYAN